MLQHAQKVANTGTTTYRLIAEVRMRDSWEAQDSVRLYHNMGGGSVVQLPCTIFNDAIWSSPQEGDEFMLFYARVRPTPGTIDDVPRDSQFSSKDLATKQGERAEWGA